MSEKFWIVLSYDTSFKTIDEAIDYAKECAEDNPGLECPVMECVGVAIAKIQPVRYEVI